MDKEKLVEIIQNSVGGCARHWAEVIADGLIAHGVTIVAKKEKKPTDLTGKCGSCVYAEKAIGHFGKAQCYVECTNKEHLSGRMYQERPLAAVRPRTTKACKKYTPQPPEIKGEK